MRALGSLRSGRTTSRDCHRRAPACDRGRRHVAGTATSAQGRESGGRLARKAAMASRFSALPTVRPSAADSAATTARSCSLRGSISSCLVSRSLLGACAAIFVARASTASTKPSSGTLRGRTRSPRTRCRHRLGAVQQPCRTLRPHPHGKRERAAGFGFSPSANGQREVDQAAERRADADGRAVDRCDHRLRVVDQRVDQPPRSRAWERPRRDPFRSGRRRPRTRAHGP
jgi:hypothetical protein